MKYFSRRLYEAACVWSDDDDSENGDGFEKAFDEWSSALNKYEARLTEIRSSLPKSMQQFNSGSFHEAALTSYSRNEDQVCIQIYVPPIAGPDCGAMELIFYGVKTIEGVERDTFLYAEIDILSHGHYEFHGLLERSEFTIVAESVELVKIPDP